MNLGSVAFVLPSLIFTSAIVLGQPAQAPPPLAIEHVTVLPMTVDGPVLHDQTVTLGDGRIAQIEASTGAKVGAGVRRIDGTGKYLMPSLTDAHMHLENDRILRLFLKNPNIPTGTIRTEDIFLPYVANGVLQAFGAAGIPVLAGTDTPVPGMVPGFALHDELEAMARYGLSNRQVLEGATRLPAEWLGVASDRGVVAVGKRADLLLLDADPMADVANTRKIAAVIAGGRFLSRSELDQQMMALDERDARIRSAGTANTH